MGRTHWLGERLTYWAVAAHYIGTVGVVCTFDSGPTLWARNGPVCRPLTEPMRSPHIASHLVSLTWPSLEAVFAMLFIRHVTVVL